MGKTRYYSNRQMQYGRPGQEARLVERGEVMELAGAPNDRVLVENNYIVDVEATQPTIDLHECSRCPKVFVDSSYKFGHDSGDNPCGKAARGEAEENDSGAPTPIKVGSMPGEQVNE